MDLMFEFARCLRLVEESLNHAETLDPTFDFDSTFIRDDLLPGRTIRGHASAGGKTSKSSSSCLQRRKSQNKAGISIMDSSRIPFLMLALHDASYPLRPVLFGGLTILFDPIPRSIVRRQGTEERIGKVFCPVNRIVFAG